ncbi:MAG: gfo/Idh/MocA family oxidoreductase, partial [Planctomycetota bacterium]
MLKAAGLSAAALPLAAALADEEVIQGFEKAPTDPSASEGWEPISDRKIRVGLVGYGVCRFGAAFG